MRTRPKSGTITGTGFLWSIIESRRNHTRRSRSPLTRVSGGEGAYGCGDLQRCFQNTHVGRVLAFHVPHVPTSLCIGLSLSLAPSLSLGSRVTGAPPRPGERCSRSRCCCRRRTSRARTGGTPSRSPSFACEGRREVGTEGAAGAVNRHRSGNRSSWSRSFACEEGESGEDLQRNRSCYARTRAPGARALVFAAWGFTAVSRSSPRARAWFP